MRPGDQGDVHWLLEERGHFLHLSVEVKIKQIQKFNLSKEEGSQKHPQTCKPEQVQLCTEV